MFGLILANQMKNGHYSDFYELLGAIEEEVKKFNWLLSDYGECGYPSEGKHNGKPFIWTNGDKLLEISRQYHVAYCFCVATAYPKDVSLEDVLQSTLPFADGYDGFWAPNVTMQNPLSEIEIIQWDATYFLIISTSKAVITKFAEKHPEALDLAQYNRNALSNVDKGLK